MVRLNTNSKISGQSLLELLIALALGVLVLITGMTMVRFITRLETYDPPAQAGTFIAGELARTAVITAHAAWKQTVGSGITAGSPYYIRKASTGLSTIAGTENVVVNGVTYARSFAVAPVARDASSGAIVASGGVDDPSTKKITTTVSWTYQGKANQISVEEYVARTQNEVLWQTDWVAGPTCPGSDPIIASSSIAAQFCLEEGGIDYTGTPGAIKVR